MLRGRTTHECVLFTHNYHAACSPPLLPLSILLYSSYSLPACVSSTKNLCDTSSSVGCLLVEAHFAAASPQLMLAMAPPTVSPSHRLTHSNSGIGETQYPFVTECIWHWKLVQILLKTHPTTGSAVAEEPHNVSCQL